MTNVVVYGTPTCPWCKKVKEYLSEKNIAFKDINVAEDDKARDELVEKTGQMSVPVIIIGDITITGFNPKEIDAALTKSS